jgi:hypothetical protein
MVKKTRKGGDFATEAYDASASFGRIMSYFQLAGGVLVGIILIAIGIYLIHKPPLTGIAEGTVTAVACVGNTNTNCNATVKYTGLDKTEHIVTIGGPYAVGQIVTLHYNPSNPNEVSTGNVSNKTTGIICLIVGILIIIAAIAWFYVVQNYKMAAAATGAMDAINIGTGLFNPNRQ